MSSNTLEPNYGIEDVPVRPPTAMKALNESYDSMTAPFNLKSCLYGPKNPLLMCPPTSLSFMMAPRRKLHASFNLDIDNNKPEKGTEQEKEPEVDYGYGYGEGKPDVKAPNDPSEPVIKRRRFQRRNSKTPQMLMAMDSPLLDCLRDLDAEEEAKERKGDDEGKTDDKKEVPTVRQSLSDLPSIDDEWDGGLTIAEELVMHLQKRRKSQM